MALFGGSARASVVVTPAVVMPCQSVQASIALAKPIDKVRSARIDMGYTNFYRYRWAGHADSAAAAATDAMWLIEDVGTNYGAERNTDDWVGVLSHQLPVAGGRFEGGSTAFRVPSWAPASSAEIARWSCRLVVERAGRDLDERGDFTVIVGHVNAPKDVGGQERVAGKGASQIDIAFSSPIFRAGEQVSGELAITPTIDLPDGDVNVRLSRYRYSHPLERNPAETAIIEGKRVRLRRGIPLTAGVPVRLPFALPLPTDAPPTAAAVHSSIAWFVEAQLLYAGWSGPSIERVRRPIVVVNAP
jgi:hypothetical protein